MRKTITNDELTGAIRQMKYSTTDPSGTNYGYELSSYDSQGNLRRWEMYNEQHEPVKNIVYRFDDKGILLEETLTKSDGAPVYKNTFYDNGQYRESCQYYGEDTYKTLYDEAGNAIAQFENDVAADIEEDPYNEQWETKKVTDTDGSIVELVYYHSFGALYDITKRKYNEQQQLVYEATYGSEKALTAHNPRSTKILAYNEHHHLIEQVDDDFDEEGHLRRTIFRYTFQYDAQHNWIEKVEIMNNKITGFQDRIQFIRKREIEYIS
jgi:YD repeat-containing protein